MRKRLIRHEKVFECAEKGRYVEHQHHGRDVKIVFQEPSEKCPECYVVIAASIPKPEVVTVCRTKEEVWGFLNGIIKRKRS